MHVYIHCMNNGIFQGTVLHTCRLVCGCLMGNMEDSLCRKAYHLSAMSKPWKLLDAVVKTKKKMGLA